MITDKLGMTGLGKRYKKLILKKRTYAFTVDLLFISLLNKVIIQSYGMFLKTFFYHLSKPEQLQILQGLDKVFLGVLTTIFMGYFVISYYMGEGQTPGKVLFGLKVHSKNSEPLPLISCINRTIGYVVCHASFLLLYGLPFITKKGLGVQDWLSGTYVDRVNPMTISKATVIPLPAPEEDVDRAA